jgi:hypothetical protein
MKNAAVLLGIPVAGVLAGIGLAALLTRGFTGHPSTGALATACGLVLGIVLGVFAFRRISRDTEAVIDRIIDTHMVLNSPHEKTQGCVNCERSSR